MTISSAAITAQEKRSPWSFYIDGGVGNQQLATLKGIQIPESAKEYLNTRGINTLNIETGTDKIMVPNANIGVSYSPVNALAGRSRVSLHLGNQNLSQKSYHAVVASAEILFGYDILRHPHHDLSLELGAGAYATFNNMVYTWRGLDGDGNQIYVDGVPEQITVDMGWHNTIQPSVPARVSYTYNVAGSSWIGAYAQARYIPKHDSYVPTFTASAGIEYRYTFGRKKQAYVKEARTRAKEAIQYIRKVDTVYVHDTVYVRDTVANTVRDTVYVEKVVEKRSPVYVLFELGSSDLTKYERYHLENMELPENAVVDLAGYACILGNRELNEKFAVERVEKVRKVLESRGVKVNSAKTEISEFAAPNFRAVEIKFIEK